MKKIILSGVIVLGFIFYALNTQSAPVIPVTPVPNNSPSPMMTTTGMMNRGLYKDGTYTGNVADAYYGNVQVQTTIVNGKITDIQFLQYPSDRRTSQEINSQAMPILKQETIAGQNAQVDMVSGATQTSRAYIESLQSALAKAS